MAIAREAESVGSLTRSEAASTAKTCWTIYRNMLITRGVEERGHILYKQGKIPGSFYTGRGNEARRSRSRPAMVPDDVGTPLHRDMGVHITRGVEPWRIFANYMGRADGPTRAGRQRPHGRRAPRADRDGQPPAGDAARSPSAARSRSGSARRSASRRLVRRGRSRARRRARGDELRRRPQLPMVFICDNNQWAYSTPTHLEYATEHSPTARRRTASRASSSTAPTCSPSTARRSARSRRRARAAARR
jgi:pyruvate dehydrogenase E1 component alpha subunit